VTFSRHVQDRLDDLRAAGLHRGTVTIDSPPAPEATIDGRRMIQLASNDYLGLAAHPALADAVARGAHRWGSGAGAAALVTGHTRAHADAERALSAFVGEDRRTLLFPAGYMANVGTVQALVGRGDLVLSDALNHASLIDGARLSGARVLVYPHRDVDAARALLEAHRGEHRAALLITDAIFSMDATAAPLAALRALTTEHATGLLVDEAHALGVVGPAGRGLCARDGVTPDVLIGTLGKAFGLMGAFAAGPPETIDLLRNRARSFVFATALSPAIAAAIPRATELVASADDRRIALADAADRLASGLHERGYDVRPETGPILPVWLGTVQRAMAVASALFERGIFVRAIRPPTVPPGTARLRLVPSATTTPEHVDAVLAALPPVDA
jgi:8-amino-7-oxononanoate synthase